MFELCYAKKPSDITIFESIKNNLSFNEQYITTAPIYVLFHSGTNKIHFGQHFLEPSACTKNKHFPSMLNMS